MRKLENILNLLDALKLQNQLAPTPFPLKKDDSKNTNKNDSSKIFIKEKNLLFFLDVSHKTYPAINDEKNTARSTFKIDFTA